MKNNLKSEKGAISLIALVTVLFIMSFLMSMYIILSNRAQSSAETTAEIARRYNNIGDAQSIYNSYLPDENIIPITSVEQLKLMGSDEKIEINGKYYTYSNDGYYILLNDLDLGGYDSANNVWLNDKQWTPLSSEFTGYLDGLGHTIRGLYINNTSNDYQGLFGTLNGTVKNLNIKDSYVKARQFVGAIAGLNSNNGTIQNCYNYSPVIGTNYVGGIAGSLNGTIINCKNTGSVLGDTNVTGGFFTEVGQNGAINVWSKNKVLDRNCEFVSGDKTAVVPKGFKVSADVLEQTIEDGMVIQDVDGNEFVWVPVNVTTTGEFDNLRITKNNTDYEEPAAGDETEYNAMRTSVITNGGFYIARYEAGYSMTTGRIRTDASVATTPLSKKGAYPYDYVNWIDAVSASRSMYNDSTKYGVTSTLCYGVQWDTMLGFLGKTSETDSTTWGNYKNAGPFDFKGEYYDYNSNQWKNDTTSKAKDTMMLLQTGASDRNSLKNIYDVAGNVFEWTMESYDAGGLREGRGGSYSGDGDSEPASDHYDNDPYDNTNGPGFRTTLYIN